MDLKNKRPRYQSAAPEPTGAGGLPLLDHLQWKAERNAPAFAVGNLLVHGPCTQDPQGHHLDADAGNFRRTAPALLGLHHTSLFPVTASVETTDRLTDQAGAVRFLFQGREVPPVWRPEGRLWTPWSVTDEFDVGALRVRQTVTVAAGEGADVLACRLLLEGDTAGWEYEVVGRVFRPVSLTEIEGGWAGEIVGESPDFRFVTAPGYPGPWGSGPAPSKAVGSRFAVAVVGRGGWDQTAGAGWTYRWTGSAGPTLHLLFAAGFEASEVASELAGGLRNPDAVVDRARKAWSDTFRRDVPALSCSDPALERIYAESLATGFLSTYDVPYDPFRHPISVPAAKVSANWHQQFWHDSLFASRSFLWLNDPQRCQQDLLQMAGTQFIHARPDFGDPYPDPAHLFHPQLNFLAMVGWQIYCRTRDRGLIRLVLDRFLAFDRLKCRPPAPGTRPQSRRDEEPAYSILRPNRHYDEDGNGLVTSALSGDDTCRADPFLEGHRAKHWYEEPDVSLELVDSNWYLLGNRKALRNMAVELGDEAVVRELDEVMAHQAAAIEATLWDPALGGYFDAETFTGRRSTVADIGAITPALANGLVPTARADRLIADLLDPRKFWTPVPAPSCPLDHFGTNGKTGFRPEGYWRGRVWPLFIVEAIEGLHRYGYRDHAAYLVHRFLQTLAASPVPAPENLNPLDKSVPGFAWMSFGSQFVHPLLRFVTGLQMDPGDDLTFDPLALDPAWESFAFGPFRYRPDVELQVDWNASGYAVTVNGQTWRFPQPTRFVLVREGAAYRLDPASVHPLTFVGTPQVETKLGRTAEGAQVRLHNRTDRPQTGRLIVRLLVLDRSLDEAVDQEYRLGPGEEQSVFLADQQLAEASWLLTATTTEGYPVTVTEGLSL